MFYSCEPCQQCAIPVFDQLLPDSSNNETIQTLLFELSTWHALAKLRLHTETTICNLEHSSRRLGFELREFKRSVCSKYKTKELPSEYAARSRRKAALAAKKIGNGTSGQSKGSSRNEKVFNLSTYKLHSLGDYAAAIRRYGPTDNYTTQVVRSQMPDMSTIY
jgi:hypothetical protein